MNAIRTVADLMAVAARTAPKSAGQDYVVLKVIEGDECQRLADEMIKYGQETGKKNFGRDGRNVAASAAMLLVGIKDASSLGLSCGACGFDTCDERTAAEHGEFVGPQCAFRVLDMGIALGSAAKMAGLLNVDNRIMYRAGVVARQMGLINADFVMGIPLSVTGKSIYFDR
ncbi:MAG: hypothetical protein KKA73_15445 [Chloroflexi bacterium]|nr:hypothetical protein [Chloroflexota bacterium]MBU1749079.1 hypothetical protein [Chloroflexota bacterium]MBU1880304.1 hypothetical protein [Chloroflexota bacterium]